MEPEWKPEYDCKYWTNWWNILFVVSITVFTPTFIILSQAEYILFGWYLTIENNRKKKRKKKEKKQKERKKEKEEIPLLIMVIKFGKQKIVVVYNGYLKMYILGI